MNSLAPERPLAFEQKLAALRGNIERAIQGKSEVVDLTLTALLAKGHLLIEDVPGVGKTTLARALARSIGGSFHRIQFTSDLLPSDILGVNIFDPSRNRFEFKPGPLFANIIVADEINRTTPKTQSCLLEAMNERQVSIDGTTYRLEEPFMVVATQNPHEFYGTYPLPESQLDRFLLRIRVGYPAQQIERTIIAERTFDEPVEALRPVIGAGDVRDMQANVESVHFDDALLDYLMSLVTETRQSPLLALGVSTRGGLSLHRAARARALVLGRDYCIPDDVKELVIPALAHRILPANQHGNGPADRDEGERILRDLLERIPVPT